MIPRKRYLELKDYCMQYAKWKLLYLENSDSTVTNKEQIDITPDKAIKKIFYKRRTDMIENIARIVSEKYYDYILKGVTELTTYSQLKRYFGLDCDEETYKKMYRRFFYILSRNKHLVL